MRSAGVACLVALLGSSRPATAADRGARAQIEEELRLGEQSWTASCPKPTEDGSCVEYRPTAFRPRLFAIDRDPALVAEARRHFVAAAKLWRRLGGGEILGAQQSTFPNRSPSPHANYAAIFRVDPDEEHWESTSGVVPDPAPALDAGAARAAAGTAFYLAEAEFERYVRVERPFDPRLLWDGPAGDRWYRKSHWERRFERYLTRKLDQLARTRRMYVAVFATRQAPFDVAAVARIGQLYEGLDNDTRVALVDESAVAEALDRKTARAFERCFAMDAKDGRYDAWFHLCEHELTGLRPSEFPKANEFVPEADKADRTLAPVPPISRLE